VSGAGKLSYDEALALTARIKKGLADTCDQTKAAQNTKKEPD
jgi:hypothetical protein